MGKRLRFYNRVRISHDMLGTVSIVDFSVDKIHFEERSSKCSSSIKTKTYLLNPAESFHESQERDNNLHHSIIITNAINKPAVTCVHQSSCRVKSEPKVSF